MNKIINRKLALFQHTSVLVNPHSEFKDCYVACGENIHMVDFHRVTEWQECFFTRRSIEDIQNERIIALLREIEINKKGSFELTFN